MARYFRLWLLLVPILAFLVANPLNHHMIVIEANDHFWIKGKASVSEIVAGSFIFGVVASTLVTLLHAGVESVLDRRERIE